MKTSINRNIYSVLSLCARCIEFSRCKCHQVGRHTWSFGKLDSLYTVLGRSETGRHIGEDSIGIYGRDFEAKCSLCDWFIDTRETLARIVRLKLCRNNLLGFAIIFIGRKIGAFHIGLYL